MTKNEEEKALTEIKIMQILSSPFVVQIKDHLHVKKSVTIVMEHASKGDMESAIKKANNDNKPFSVNLTKKWIAQLLTGLSHVHDNNIIHRDLKSGNIF